MPISTGLQCVRGQAELCRFAPEGRGLCKDVYLNVMLVCINVFDLSQAQLYHSNLATNHSLEPLCFAYNTAWSLVFATHCTS